MKPSRVLKSSPARLEWARAYYWRKRDRILALQARRRQEDPEKDRRHSREWRKNNPEKMREQGLRPYGVTPAEWDAMLVAQCGRCVMCDLPMMGNKKKEPAVDHDHETKKVRGLAHAVCNLIVGLAHEDPHLLRLLANFSERSSRSSSSETF